MTQPPSREPNDFDRAQLVLEDARERARRIIDQSVADAQELLARRAPGPSQDASLPRALGALSEEMRDVRQRLDRIEGLLLRQEQSARMSASPAPVAPAEFVPAAAPVPPPVYTPPAPPAPAAAQPPPPPPQPTATPPPPEPVAPVEASADRLMPEGGPITVLVSPVAGFQGLMRVQEALVRIDAVSEAIVEGYAQGEARLRLQLREPVTPVTLGAGLSASLAQRADVQLSTAGDRTLRVALS